MAIALQLGAVEIDVDVKVKSDGGALDESGKATLRARRKRRGPRSRSTSKAEDIQGDLVLRDSKPAGFVLDGHHDRASTSRRLACAAGSRPR